MFILVNISCIPLNSHESGRSIGKGNFNVGGNYTLGKINSEQYFTINPNGKYHIAEVNAVHGITNRADVGIKVNTSGHISWFGKYQLIGNQKSLFASSVGLESGFGPLPLVVTSMSYSYSAALFNSVHITKNIAFTLSPRYVYLGFTNYEPQFQGQSAFTRELKSLGFSSGIIYGNEYQFSVEYSYHSNRLDIPIENKGQVSFGCKYRFKID